MVLDARKKRNLLISMVASASIYLVGVSLSKNALYENNVFIEVDDYEYNNLPYKALFISKAKNERFLLRFCVGTEQIRRDSDAKPSAGMRSASNIDVYCEISLLGQLVRSLPYLFLSFAGIFLLLEISGKILLNRSEERGD